MLTEGASMSNDKKYKIDFSNCMKYDCNFCKYKMYCFKDEKMQGGVGNGGKRKQWKKIKDKIS